MITLDKFKQFLGFGIPGVEAQRAVGLVIVMRTIPLGEIVAIPGDLLFLAGGQTFVLAGGGRRELNESQSFTEIPLQAQHTGPAGNIGIGQNWTMNQEVDFRTMNHTAFSGGVDEIPDKQGLYPHLVQNMEIDIDDRLQECIDLGKKVVRELAGVDDSVDDDGSFFNDPCLMEAVYLVGMYRLEQNTTRDRIFNAPSSQPGWPELRAMFKDRTFLPLMAQVQSLISQSGKRNISLWFENATFQPSSEGVSKF